MTADSCPLDGARIRRAFDRASASYDTAAVLQAEVREILLQRLDLIDWSPRLAVDVGAGTGHGSRTLKQRYPRAQVIALDFSLNMLRAAARRRSWLRPFARVCADAAQLPFADGGVDLIVSNFALQWCDLDAVFREFRRVLAPRGLLSFATLGPDTLRELRSAWGQVDSRWRVIPFMDMHDIGDGLVRAGFAAPVLDVDRYTLEYSDVRGLALDLRAVGACNAVAERSKGLTTPRRFAAMQAAYERFRDGGRLPATYEVVFGQAWQTAGTKSGAGTGAAAGRGAGESHVSLSAVQRALRRRRDS